MSFAASIPMLSFRLERSVVLRHPRCGGADCASEGVGVLGAEGDVVDCCFAELAYLPQHGITTVWESCEAQLSLMYNGEMMQCGTFL